MTDQARTRDRLLANQIEYLSERSPFYAARLGAPVKTVEDLQHVEFLTKDDRATTSELHRLLGFFDEIRKARAWDEEPEGQPQKV